jgi:hypothetical protein
VGFSEAFFVIFDMCARNLSQLLPEAEGGQREGKGVWVKGVTVQASETSSHLDDRCRNLYILMTVSRDMKIDECFSQPQKFYDKGQEIVMSSSRINVRIESSITSRCNSLNYQPTSRIIHSPPPKKKKKKKEEGIKNPTESKPTSDSSPPQPPPQAPQ